MFKSCKLYKGRTLKEVTFMSEVVNFIQEHFSLIRNEQHTQKLLQINPI